jgi:hypothetical protein
LEAGVDTTNASDYIPVKTTILDEVDPSSLMVPIGTQKTLRFISRVVENNPRDPILNIKVPDFLHVPLNGKAMLLSN